METIQLYRTVQHIAQLAPYILLIPVAAFAALLVLRGLFGRY